MLIPNKHNGYTRDGIRRVYISSGGGGGGQTSTQFTTNVPEYARQPFMDMIGRGVALSETKFQPFTGQRQADFTNLQNQAFTQAGQQGVAGQIGAASGLAGAAGLGGLASRFDPMQTGQFDAQTAAQYMDPFMQNVVNIQQREAQRQADIAGTQRGAQAVRAGAFGGSRQAIVDAEAQRNLAQQMGDIQATGSQAAFRQAQEQFGRDQQLQEQSRQFGAEFGQRGLSTALQGAQALGQLGQQQFGQEMDVLGARQQMGGIQQQQEQRRLDQQFGDFQTQRDFPFQQVGFLSDLLRGTGSSTRSIAPQPTALQNITGLGTAALGASQFMAKGGEVKSYADGGITGLLNDQQLAERQQTASPMGQLAADQVAQQRDAMRQAVPADMPRDMDMTEQELMAAMQRALQEGDRAKARVIAEIIEERRMPESGIAGIAPDSVGEMPEGGLMAMAGGGMVSFEDGGRVRSPYGLTPLELEEQRILDRERVMRGLETTGSLIADLGIAVPRSAVSAYDMAVVRPLRAAGLTRAGYLSPHLTPEGADPSSLTPFYDRLSARDSAPQISAAAPADIEQVVPGQAATDAMRNQSRAAQRNAAQARMAEQKALEEAETPPDEGPGITSLMSQFNLPQARAAVEGRIKDDERAAIERINEDVARHDEFFKNLGVLGTEKEERLRGDIEGIKGEKSKAAGMALFQAGLSILSADPSRGAFAAIGEGAAKGLAGYKGSLKDLEARRDRMTDKLDNLDALRRQESIASEAGRRSITQQRNKVFTEFAKEYRALGQEMDINIPLAAARQVAEQTFQADQNQRNRESLEARAGGGAGGRKFDELTAAQKSKLKLDAEKLWNGMKFLEQRDVIDAGLTREQWVNQKARSLIDGPDADSAEVPTGANFLGADELVGISP